MPEGSRSESGILNVLDRGYANFGEFLTGEVRRMEILRRNCIRMNKVSDQQDVRYEASRVVWNHTNDTPEVMQPVS
jgi:hypothetical protein